jgi:hypothetical protein
MGCTPSAQASKGGKQTQKGKGKPDGKQTKQTAVAHISPVQRFDMIVNGATQIAAPSHMMPIVCLSPEAFPVITSSLQLEDSASTEIQLPIIAGSTKEHGRILAFAQLQFLSDPAFHSPGTSSVIEGALSWLAGGPTHKSIALAGFDDETASSIETILQELSFTLSCSSAFSDAHVVIIPSDIDLEAQSLGETLLAYIVQGGGLAVFHRHNEDTIIPLAINTFLIQFGLAFTVCLLNETLDSPDTMPVPASFTYVKDRSFGPIVEHFKATLKQAEIDPAILDDLVTTMRYYIMICDESYGDALVQIAEASWDFLHRTHYLTADGFCPDMEQGIIVVLLQELYATLPIVKCPPIPELSFFPGVTGTVSLKDYPLNLTLKPEMWTSTGLWLPAGVAGKILLSEPMANVSIQIGSHCESLLVQPGPWKRWPSVVTEFELAKTKIDVGSVFGGIVYAILSGPTPEELPPSLELSITLKHFCQYPRYLHSDPAMWKTTKDIEVPWGEIDLGDIVFTLPSPDMRRIKDFGHLKKKYDEMIAHLIGFMSHELVQPYRIVFDIELPEDGPRFGYPSVLLLDDMDGVLIDLETPNMNLFKALSLIAIVSIREDCFDVQIETALASTAAAVVFKGLFPKFDPFNFAGLTLPPLFAELWNIHTSFSKTLIPSLIEEFKSPDHVSAESSEDLWVSFVRELCLIGKRNFTKFLGTTRPIPLNISPSILALPAYP